ncbi:SRPBCC family protein [Streptomyces sp. NPDC050504]|uniref:SRPBCC family protein n=1 Tax=Streptomyces sp. NPDC050504 TaxID=3365618 RepID=UPI00378F4D00
MARRHRLISAPPQVVWDVLADGERYAEWVVGASDSRPAHGQWPQLGSSLRYEIRLGPLRLTNETVVRGGTPGSSLELEAKAGFLGTARIGISLLEWGEECLVIVDEHPLRGVGGMLHNAGVEAVIQLRHRAMLARLARLCEKAPGTLARSTGAEGR